MHRNRLFSNSAINLNDESIELVNDEIKEMTTNPIDNSINKEYLKNVDNTKKEKDIIIFEKWKIFICAIMGL